MAYATVSLIWEGALDEEEDMAPEEVEPYIDRIRQEVAEDEDASDVEVIVVWHDHDDLPEDAEDVCAQYADAVEHHRLADTRD